MLHGRPRIQMLPLEQFVRLQYPENRDDNVSGLRYNCKQLLSYNLGTTPSLFSHTPQAIDSRRTCTSRAHVRQPTFASSVYCALLPRRYSHPHTRRALLGLDRSLWLGASNHSLLLLLLPSSMREIVCSVAIIPPPSGSIRTCILAFAARSVPRGELANPAKHSPSTTRYQKFSSFSL